MLHNVKSFLQNYQAYFQIALGVWQILKFTPPAALIKGLMGSLLSVPLPRFFPAYKQLQHYPGCLFKTVKCVVLTEGMSQSKTKQLTASLVSKETDVEGTSKSQAGSSTRSNTSSIQSTARSMPQSLSMSGDCSEKKSFPYLNRTFEVKRWDANKICQLEEKCLKEKDDECSEEENNISVRQWTYYNISDRQWNKIRQLEEKCFSEKKNKVVFVKGCKYIWEKVATGKVMEFEEVLDDIIFENNDSHVLISNDVWFLPVDLSEKSEGKLPKLLNLVGLIPRVSKDSFWVSTFLTIAAAVLEFWESLRSWIYKKIDKMFCGSVQYICNKLPYLARKCVYLLFIWVENMKPRNDIRLKVVGPKCLNVFIGGAAKTNSPLEGTPVNWLKKRKENENYEYKFLCGRSIDMKAEYDKGKEECTATMQHSNGVFRSAEQKVFLKCKSGEEFMKIGTLLSCLAASKAGSLFKYDRKDNKVHVRGWRESLRHYVDAEFPDIYEVRLHDYDVIV